MQSPVIRLLTCGSVDDGKSTLIGRLLVETDSVPHDTVKAARTDRRSGSTIAVGEIDFSLLTDGLAAEREQGITIDVAHRSMSLLNGKRLIISDAPGHEEYTRNMAVAASRADVALVLVDAPKGIRTQTLRHLTICSLMGVQRVIVAINKLDAQNYSEDRFEALNNELEPALSRLGLKDLISIPMSALIGDNVVTRSQSMSWYKGPTLLESIQDWSPSEIRAVSATMPIQSISRADNFRGLSGTVIGNSFKVGDEVSIFPSNKSAKISRIVNFDGDVDKVEVNIATTLELTPEVDASRGDVVVASGSDLAGSDRFTAHLIWFDEQALIHSRSYMLVSGHTQTPAIITKIKNKLDVVTGAELSANTFVMNEIGTVEIATDAPLLITPYSSSRELGNFILVDRMSSHTVAAGMVQHTLRRGSNIHQQSYEITKEERSKSKGQKAQVLWLTGLSGSGKSTIANALEKKLFSLGMHPYVLDGDNLRLSLNKDLGFTKEDRAENVRRVAEVAKLLVDAGLIVITALVSPFEQDRAQAKEIFEAGEFKEIFVDTPLDVCIERDPKGLYKKAAKGEIPNFTGVGQDYETPKSPDLTLDGTDGIEQSVAAILKEIL
jgi:bifunctional enzyme CysN/CysC